MTTNLYGIPDQMEKLVEIGGRRDILLIEDACQALDSRLGTKRVGEFVAVAVFSLSKHIAGVGDQVGAAGFASLSQTNGNPAPIYLGRRTER